MTDAKAPERVWIIKESRSHLVSDRGEIWSGDPKAVAYVRGDLYSAISKERYELQAEVERLTSVLRKIAGYRAGTVDAGMSPWDAEAALQRK